jgi:hypothetical protein
LIAPARFANVQFNAAGSILDRANSMGWWNELGRAAIRPRLNRALCEEYNSSECQSAGDNLCHAKRWKEPAGN